MSRRLLVAVASLLAVACTVQRVHSAQSLSLDDHMAHMSAADLSQPAVTQPNVVDQTNPDLPASDLNAAARLKASPRHSEWVKIAWEPGAKDSLMAWVVYPKSTGKAPVVVVVHEVYGLSTWVRGVADQVAAEGFIAIAPDFNSRVRGGPSTEELTRDSAMKLSGGVNSTERNRAIVAAANHAMMQSSAEQKYAVIGYCWGGQTTFFHAIHGGVKGFVGGVAYYGLPYQGRGQPATATTAAVPAGFLVDSLMKIKVPVLLFSGTGDARITAAMPALDSAMKKLGKEYSGTNYAGAVHGFLRAQDDPNPRGRNPAEEAANLAATKDAWPKTVAFLKKALGVK